MFTSTKASAALLALHALGVSAHYLPRNVEPFFKRDANTYRLSSRVIERRAAGPTAGLKIQGDDVIYFANMVIGGKELTVQVDTGSTDLWVYVPDGSIKFSNTTDIEVPLAYGTGNLTGHITFADVEFGPYQIPNQAFVNATATQDFDTMFDRNIVGILGLSFSERTSTMVPSTVNAVLEQKYGNDTHLGESVIGNIFLQSPSLPNSFDVLIGRSIAENDISEGYFSIGEHVPGFENVAKKPKLPRVSSGRWGVAVDGFEVNGQQIPFQNKSVVPGAPDGKIVGVLDTGATLAQVPPNLVKALYGSVPGAIFEETTGLWFLPCDATTNFTVVMGGEPIPIHPLDISRVLVTEFAVNGKNQNVTFCTNSWQPFSLPENFAGLDALLGDAFLRNVYASFDFGDQGTEDNSFIQLLPIYESAKAHAEFPQLRAEQLKGRPPALSPAEIIKLIEQADAAETATAVASSTVAPNTPTATPAATRSASRPQSTPTNDDDGDNDDSEAVGSAVRLSDGTDGSAVGILDKWGPVIIGLLAGNLVVTLILCVIGIAMCVNNRKGYRVRNTVSYGPVLTRERDGTEYSDSFLAKGDH